MKNEIKEAILEVTESMLVAQLKAIRRMRGTSEEEEKKEKSKSQVDMVYDILSRAGSALHISEIIERVEKLYGVHLERESIVSALSKKINRDERFVRTGKNIFGVKGK